jgi:hypothetical protein
MRLLQTLYPIYNFGYLKRQICIQNLYDETVEFKYMRETEVPGYPKVSFMVVYKGVYTKESKAIKESNVLLFANPRCNPFDRNPKVDLFSSEAKRKIVALARDYR